MNKLTTIYRGGEGRGRGGCFNCNLFIHDYNIIEHVELVLWG